MYEIVFISHRCKWLRFKSSDDSYLFAQEAHLPHCNFPLVSEVPLGKNKIYHFHLYIPSFIYTGILINTLIIECRAHTNFSLRFFAQSAGAVEYTDCFSAEGKTLPTTSVLVMTLNNLMVRFQQCCSFGECVVPLHCHRSQVHSDPEW